MLVRNLPNSSHRQMPFRIWVYQNQKDQQKRGPDSISRLLANACNLKARFSSTASGISYKRKKLMEISWLISYSLSVPARGSAI